MVLYLLLDYNSIWIFLIFNFIVFGSKSDFVNIYLENTTAQAPKMFPIWDFVIGILIRRNKSNME